jgi:hypothetical protein
MCGVIELLFDGLTKDVALVVISLFLGTFFGIFMMCLLIISKRGSSGPE